MGIGGRTMWNTAIAACLGVVLLSTTAIAHGGNNMEPIYDLKDSSTLQPQTFKSGGLFGGYKNVSIFPVPQNNSVGSNDMGNAINSSPFPKAK